MTREKQIKTSNVVRNGIVDCGVTKQALNRVVCRKKEKHFWVKRGITLENYRNLMRMLLFDIQSMLIRTDFSTKNSQIIFAKYDSTELIMLPLAPHSNWTILMVMTIQWFGPIFTHTPLVINAWTKVILPSDWQWTIYPIASWTFLPSIRTKPISRF